MFNFQGTPREDFPSYISAKTHPDYYNQADAGLQPDTRPLNGDLCESMIFFFTMYEVEHIYVAPVIMSSY